MKNWKYIEGAKVGNSLGTDIYQHKLDPNQYMVVDWDKQTVTIIVNGHVRDVIKNLNNLAYALHLYKKVNVMNTKTGNDTPLEYAHRKPKVINDDKTGAEEFFKKLSDDVKEREKKDDADIEKVGNAKDKNGKELRVGDIVLVWTSAGERAGKVKAISGDRITVAIRNEGDWSTPGKLADKVSNSKVGNREVYVNQSEQTKAVVYEDGTIMLWDKNGNNYKTIKAGSLEEARKKLNSDYKKVGNKTYKVKESSGHDGGYDYGYIVVDESNRSVGRTFSTRSEAEEYIRDLYKKEKVGNANLETSVEKGKLGLWNWSDKYKMIERQRKDVEAMINKYRKTGNATPNYRYKDFLITNPEGHEYIVFLKDGRTVGYRGTTSKAQAEDWCDWHDPKTGKSIGNKVSNSASDDKFAYVMREFDEGKLKTPDGKVVTDPAQAKAIAYSESKKTENGLARARNAMNKKCGNSQVTLWKGNDSVLISEDGTVQYLESNSFETDRDKYGSMQEAIDDLTKKGYRKK